MPGTLKLEKNTAPNHSDLIQMKIQIDNLVKDMAAVQQSGLTDDFIGWYGLGANSGTDRMLRASTDTQLATAAMVINVAGIRAIKAATATGTTFGALGTIPTGTWGLIAVDAVLAGTITYVSAAASYTTGYATEAAAIAAMPPRTTLKSRVGYLTILAASPGWVAATDALAGGSSGTPATTTNYYPAAGIMAPQGLAYNGNGVVSLGLLNGTFHPAWSGGYNGMLQATTLAIGSTDTRISNSVACMFNANGLTNIPKAATAAGTALGALGTIPADQWGVLAVMIDGAGAITYLSGSANYTSGYASESQAINALAGIYPATTKAFLGYVTLKTKAATAWIAQTDAFAGGASGNPASVTNYYSTPGVTLAQGESASLIASRSGVIYASSQY